MNNNADHIILNANDTPTVTFTNWPLDIDDDEFRAGYPFTSLPLEEINEQEPQYDILLTLDHDAFPSIDSHNNDFNKTTNEVNESSCFSSRDQNEFMEFNVKSPGNHDDGNHLNVNINEKQDHEEDERKQYDHYNIVHNFNVNDKQTNQTHPAK